MSQLARLTEPNLKLFGWTLKVYLQVKFSGVTFGSQSKDILDRCNTKYQRLKFLVNQKWESSPPTIIQIYKQCVRPIFEYGSFSTITTLDNIISKNSTAPKQIYTACPPFT